MRFEILVNLRNSAAPLTGSDDLDVTGDQTGGTSNEDGDENNDYVSTLSDTRFAADTLCGTS
jgi:hypothetical protein